VVGTADKPSVVVVDDHPLWRQTVKSLLERAGVAGTVWEAATGEEAVEMVRSRRPDVVVMDVGLPGMDGVAATRAITEAGTSRVLVLLSSDDEEQVIDAVRAGATGYLLKSAGPEEIREGLRRVHAGELVVPPSLTAIVLDELRGGRRRAAGPLATLSDREVSVLALMAEGFTNETIGRTMHLSPKTVESHVTSIFMKLGLDPSAGGHRRVLAVVTYLRAARKRGNPEGAQGRP
jgi:DNA-binding NarL/FixJ family response regulator